MSLQQNLVYYAAVAKGTVIVAEQANENVDLPSVAAKCLENLPPLHNRFSYTTRKRMFICLIDQIFIYCAIMDEALSKAEAFSFLEQVRDAVMRLMNDQGVDAETLGSHSLDEELGPVMRLLAAPFVGTPQKEKDREKDRLEEELQAPRQPDGDLEVSSPSAVAPVDAMSDQEFALKTEEKPLGSRSPVVPSLGKGKKGQRKANDQPKELIMENKGNAMDKGKHLEIMVDNDAPASAVSQMQKGQERARRTWWRNVKIVIILDVLACLIFLAVWLGVCQGVSCLQRNKTSKN